MTNMKTTPMLEQYLGIKKEYPDALLFYRMGDFYELFFEDAETAARDLQIALTSRNPNAENPVPMCGVPYHSAGNYLKKLLDKGHKVAVCDQVEDPKKARGLVKRAVTRVLTPGTVIEDENLAAKDHNFLAALYFSRDTDAGGLAWVDFSTGQWTGLFSHKEDMLWQWAGKIDPSELLLSQAQEIPHYFQEDAVQINRVPSPAYFSLSGAGREIRKAQGVASLSALDLDGKPELVMACGALLSYLRHTQKQDLTHLGPFQPMNLSSRLLLDEVTERNLEIFKRLDGKTGKGTLIHVLDHTRTPMGGRLLAERLRRPWKDLGVIVKTQDAVEYFFENDETRETLREALNQVYDLERLSTRISLNRAAPRDFLALRQSLLVLPRIESIFKDLDDATPKELQGTLKGWDNFEDYSGLLAKALADNPPPVITEGGLFKRGYEPKLDELLDLTEHGEAKLKSLLVEEKNSCNLEKLKLGFNKVFGYYFELPQSQSAKAPYHFIRRQTLVNSERFVTPKLKELEDRMMSASEKRKELEYLLFQKLRDTLARARPRFMEIAARLARLDYWQGLAQAAKRSEWTRPELDSGIEIVVKAGRHPVVEAVQGAANYIPNDLVLTGDTRILLITGPNMAGKSTVLRQTALLCVMAQIGSFVPADKASLGVADRVFCRVGASDNLAQGRSTFMVEMMETARILRQAGPRSLVVLDEIGRGTSTFDGLALAWAVVEDLASRGQGGVRTLFATHYHELTSLEGKLGAVRNFNIAVKEYKGDIVFLRRLIPGPSDRSYGVEVAKLAGVPRNVVTRAKEILSDLERRSKDGARPSQTASHTMLPGLRDAPEQDMSTEIPLEAKALIHELESLDVDGLTPLKALNFLHQWKSTWKKKD